MKNIMKVLGIIAIAAVIGLSMTSCEPEVKTVDIIVTNNSTYTYDTTVKAYVYDTGTTPLEEQSIPRGQSVTFTMDEGDYRVRIYDGYGVSYWYPSSYTVIEMTGVVKLNFNGTSLKLQ